jgi:DNA-directed RNA polymerase subunit H (RpoH/RPB5)
MCKGGNNYKKIDFKRKLKVYTYIIRMSSNSTRVNKIYKSRHVLLEQLEDRGYNIDDYNHFSINEIDAMFVNNQLDMLVKHTENDKQVYIKYYFTLKSNTKQMKPQVLDNIVEDLYLIDNVLTKRDTLVIVIDDEPNETILAKVKYLYEREGTFVIIHNIKRLQTNILHHTMVPKMNVLSESEVEEFKKKHHIQDEKMQLPEISRFDPQALVVGLRPGDVCKILRPSITALDTTYYRVCC